MILVANKNQYWSSKLLLVKEKCDVVCKYEIILPAILLTIELVFSDFIQAESVYNQYLFFEVTSLIRDTCSLMPFGYVTSFCKGPISQYGLSVILPLIMHATRECLMTILGQGRVFTDGPLPGNQQFSPADSLFLNQEPAPVLDKGTSPLELH